MARWPRVVAAALVLALGAACADQTDRADRADRADEGPEAAAPTPAPSATPTSTPTPTPTPTPDTRDLEPDPPVAWWRGRRGVEVDGVRAAIPEGYDEGHLRPAYAFLGYHDRGLVGWLALVAPVQVSVAPPGDTSGLRPAPRDLLAFVERAEGVTVERLGTIRVGGSPVPVVRLDGNLTLCPRDAGSATCRWNTPERFYAFVPYRGGTLVVEGEAPQTAADDALLAELQEWGDTIQVP